MIRLRDDDVLVPTRSYPSSFARFRRIHEWLKICPSIIHVPTIVTQEIEAYPGCIEYIRTETAAGRMEPQLHGVLHIDYSALPIERVRDDLLRGIEWMLIHLGVSPSIWYTPWGSTQETLRAAAASVGLELVGVERHWMIDRVNARLRSGDETVESLQGREVFFHWWGGGLRVLRLAHAINHGSWAAAAKAERSLFVD